MGPELKEAWDKIVQAGPGGRGKGHSPAQWLKGIVVHAQDPKTGHRFLLEFVDMAINGDPQGNVKALMANMARALNEVYPPLPEDQEEIIQHEGNVTKRLGYVPTADDEDEEVIDAEYEDADDTSAGFVPTNPYEVAAESV